MAARLRAENCVPVGEQGHSEPGCRLYARRRDRGSCAGYSLLEVMTVLALVLVLLSVAVPSFQSLLERQKMTSTVNALFAAVHLTRSEAIHRGRRVDLVPAGDGTDWNAGWLVLVDANLNQQADAGEEVVFSHGPVSPSLRIQGAFTDSSVQYLAYTGSGRTRTNANSQTAQLGSWMFTLGKERRRLVISFTGRPRICTPSGTSWAC